VADDLINTILSSVGVDTNIVIIILIITVIILDARLKAAHYLGNQFCEGDESTSSSEVHKQTLRGIPRGLVEKSCIVSVT